MAGRAQLWRRLLLIALTGTVPMFVVSLLFVNATYSTTIELGTQERRGVAFQRRLTRVLEAVTQYTGRAERRALGEPVPAEMVDAERSVDEAIRALGSDYSGELGRALDFREPVLHARDRDEARLPILEGHWRELRALPPTPVAIADGTRKLVASLRAMIEHTTDTSALILDQDLDSYYLMDLALVALPQAEQRVFEVRAALGGWLKGEEAAPDAGGVAVLATLLGEADLARIVRDSKSSLREDAGFNGVSASLQQNLPGAVARYVEATRSLLSLLERVAGGKAVARADFETARASVDAASFDLSRVSTDELDRLLAIRLGTLQNERLGTYAVIVTTLLAVAGIIAWLIRGLLHARYAEILKTQAELSAKEAQLRALGDNLPGGVTYQVLRELDGSMRFLYLSAGVEELHGVSAEAALANAAELYDLVLDADRPALEAAELASFRDKTPFKLVARSRRKSDGSLRWLEFASAPRELPDGRVIWDGILLDITERHLAEATSRQAQQRFSHIFDESPVAIALTRQDDSTFVAVNQMFLSVTGYAREEVIGRTPPELGLYADPKQREAILEQLRESGRGHINGMALRTKSGEIREMLIWTSVITIDDEKYLLVMSLDVTEQNAATRHEHELEEQLRQTQKLEALGTLAGGIAHDFNNILGAVMSLSELTKLENPDNPLLNENLDQVLQASQRATVLVRQILSFSRQQKEERKSLQLAPIVKEALSLLRATLPATILLEQGLDGSVPDVFANATQVHQIVMNLCTNAAHAMKGQHGRIDVELTELSIGGAQPRPHVALEPGRYVRLRIRDTGHGMDPATRARIFEPFFTTKGAGEGTGLGLSVVHGIVKEYGGAITVESELGRGTTFAIYLPASSGGEAQAAGESSEAPRGHGERVLVVDDEPLLGNAVTKMLEHLGYRVSLFRSSVAALSDFRASPEAYAVLVTDYTMPDLTGMDLIREIHAVRADLPAVLVSGSSGPLSPDEVRAAGFRELLAKPVSYLTLARSLHRVLS